MSARTIGAQTPATTTHSHSANTRVIARRDSVEMREGLMRHILGKPPPQWMGSI